MAAFWEDPAQAVQGLQGGSPLLSAGGMLFKVLLLQQWYGLSDPMAEVAIGNRLSFRRFLGLGLHDATFTRFIGRIAPAVRGKTGKSQFDGDEKGNLAVKIERAHTPYKR